MVRGGTSEEKEKRNLYDLREDKIQETTSTRKTDFTRGPLEVI